MTWFFYLNMSSVWIITGRGREGVPEAHLYSGLKVASKNNPIWASLSLFLLILFPDGTCLRSHEIPFFLPKEYSSQLASAWLRWRWEQVSLPPWGLVSLTTALKIKGGQCIFVQATLVRLLPGHFLLHFRSDICWIISDSLCKVCVPLGAKRRVEERAAGVPFSFSLSAKVRGGFFLWFKCIFILKDFLLLTRNTKLEGRHGIRGEGLMHLLAHLWPDFLNAPSFIQYS